MHIYMYCNIWLRFKYTLLLSIYWSISLRQLILVNIPEIDLHQNVSLEKKSNLERKKKPRSYVLLISQIRKSRRVEIALDSLLQFIPSSVLPRQQDSQRQNYEHFRDIANDHSGDPERVGWTFRREIVSTKQDTQSGIYYL